LIVNYFNYFTEIEEHFQRARGTALFLMSPLDWALVETWKNADVPLEAVLRGIDAAFEKWRSRKVRTQMVNSLAFCAQAVLTEAQILSGAAPPRKQSAEPAFPLDELRAWLEGNAAAVERKHPEIAGSLRTIAAGDLNDLEAVEQRLSVLEEKMIAAARVAQSDEDLLAARQDLDRHLRPYRGKMTAEQLTMLEKQFLERSLLERAKLPRLCLFYMR
jgi:hypothetical protein